MNKKIETSKDGTFECPIIYKDFWRSKILDALEEKIDDWRKGKIHSLPHYERPGGRNDAPGGRWTLGGIDSIQLDDNDDVELMSGIKNELGAIYDVDKLEDWKCGLRIFSVGSSIPWHEDGEHGLVTTTYLNQGAWDRDWGGALLYQNKHGEIGVQFPEYNKMIVLSGRYNEQNNMWHAVTPIQQLPDENVLRISLQTFAQLYE